MFIKDNLIREITIKDAGYVYCLEKESYNNPWSLKDIEKEIMNSFSKNYLIKNIIIIGYIFTHIVEDKMQINNLCIGKEFRKNGYAKYLLNYTIERIRRAGVKNVYLEVRESNIEAQNLYNSKGFNYDSIRRNYYSNGENAFLMSKTL